MQKKNKIKRGKFLQWISERLCAAIPLVTLLTVALED